MQAARDQQKSYADLKRKPIDFQVGDKVMLKVSPWKGVVHFGKRGKLNPRYVGPFKKSGREFNEFSEAIFHLIRVRLEIPGEVLSSHSGTAKISIQEELSTLFTKDAHRQGARLKP
ncbi:hypothetical protein Tco_1010733 [Tanacetum coccineum]